MEKGGMRQNLKWGKWWFFGMVGPRCVGSLGHVGQQRYLGTRSCSSELFRNQLLGLKFKVKCITKHFLQSGSFQAAACQNSAIEASE